MDFHIGLTPGRLYDLVCAVAGEEMTVREFHSALTGLPTEQVQYVGTVLALQASVRERPSVRLTAAGAICRARVLRTRSMN